MGLLDGIPGVSKYISIFERIANALKHISEDVGIKIGNSPITLFY